MTGPACPFGCPYAKCKGSTCVRREEKYRNEAVLLVLNFFHCARPDVGLCRWDVPTWLRWAVGYASGFGFIEYLPVGRRQDGNYRRYKLSDSGKLLLAWSRFRREGPDECPGWEWVYTKKGWKTHPANVRQECNLADACASMFQ